MENRKSEQHWILHIQIILGTQFQLKLTILIFWTKFARKGYFRPKTEKLNIESCNVRFKRATKSQLKVTILIFWTKFAQEGY